MATPNDDFEALRAEPLVKWAGGKRGVLRQLQGLMPSDVKPGFRGRLVEPFLGGAAMFFYLQPREALLADLNQDLINLYLQVRDNLADLRSHLDVLQAKPYSAETYYEIRSHEPADATARAARFVFLNRWGWNGLYRVNSRGKFNVPFGRTASGRAPRLYDPDNVKAASRLLQRAELKVLPFEESLRQVDAGDFVYLDPPYHPLSPTSAFTSYTSSSFDLENQRRLRDEVLSLEKRTGGAARVMLSNSVAPDLVELYERQNNLRIHTIVAYRAIGASASSRGAQAELVVTNY